MDKVVKMKLISLVYLMPVIHAIAQVTTNYFPPGTINPGFFRLIYLLLALVIIYSIKKPALKNLFFITILFILYNLFLVLLNDEILKPLLNLIRLSIPLLILFVGYTLIDNERKLQTLFKAYLIALLIFIISFVLANIFGLGGSTYMEGSFYIGGAGVGAANELAVLIIIAITFLIINDERKWKLFAIILVVIALILILVSLRRGAFLILAGALVVFYFLSPYKSEIFKYSLLTGAILIILFPLYGSVLVERYGARAESRGGTITNIEVENRFLEFFVVPESLNREGGLSWAFGTHNLNSEVYFGGRELHVGYMAILHGTGIIGFVLFFIFKWSLIYKGAIHYKKAIKSDNIRLYYALYLVLIISIFIYLLTSRLHGFSVTFLTYLMLGSLLKSLKRKRFDYEQIIKCAIHLK